MASGELRPVIEHSLHSELTNVLAGTVDADLEHAPTDEIARAVSPVIERDRERAFIARLEQALATGGAAAAGLDEVLSTLQVQRVEALLIPERSSLTAHLCPRCGRLSATDSGACPFDGAILGQVDPIAHAIEQAARQSADVVVIHHETDSLTKHGHIAALLRW